MLHSEEKHVSARRRELRLQMEECDGRAVVEPAMMVGSERQINAKLVRRAQAVVQRPF